MAHNQRLMWLLLHFLPACALLLCFAGTPAIASDLDGTTLLLSPSEQAWLDAHPEIVLAPAAHYFPFEFFDDSGNYRGMAADFVTLLKERTGIKFKIIRIEDKKKRAARIRANGIDMVVAVTAKPGYSNDMLLSKPYLAVPAVIVSYKEYQGLGSLRNKRVAVVSGQQWGNFIGNTFPDLHLTRVADIIYGLQLLSAGKVDALVSDKATISYYIHNEGMTDLVVGGRIDNNLELRIAIRQDWPELLGIMDKVIASVSDAEKEKIYQQWIHLSQPSLLKSRAFWTIILFISAAVLFLLTAILVWNRTLKKQVSLRTQSLNHELQLRHEAETKLQGTHDNLVKSHKKLKETQFQLMHAEKMESVGRLAAGVAHEVKNPLSVIRLGLDYITDEIEKNDSSNEVLMNMDDAVNRASQVINSLLDFSRESVLQKQSGDLNRVIEDSLLLVKHELVKNNIKLIKNLDVSIPGIALDHNRMEQVFVNLFLNAIQAMHKNGTLSVSTYRRNHGKTSVIAEICDTGPGIENSIMGKVFDPFFTTKKTGEGTGLGLAITRNIIDLHNGAIDIRNKNAGGVSVRILLKPEDMEK